MTAATREQVLARLHALQSGDLPVHGGRTLAYVYDSGLPEADALALEALGMFAGANGLDPTAFPSLMAMENDLVAFAGAWLDAPAGFAGTVTSGGTESCLLAVLGARDAWRAAGGQGRPTVVLPATAHASFHKAGHLFEVDTVVVPVDPVTHRADPAAMAAAYDDSTCLVVASAPSYAHGVVDPVTEIAADAARHGVRCHVDACIGGWVLPHLDGVPSWTFAVPGVTSISADLHKYGYSPKGVSLLLHRSAELRRPQLYAFASWAGYPVVNTTIQSTKSGGPLAAAWALTQHLATDGYRELARAARATTLEVAAAVDGIPGVFVVAPPDSTLLTLATDESCDVFTIADEMADRGWFVQPQLSAAGTTASLHLTVSAGSAQWGTELLEALGGSVAAARAAGPMQVAPELVGLLQQVDPATLDAAGFGQLLAAGGLVHDDGTPNLPKRMGTVNALLDAAPPRTREALLIGFLDALTMPQPL